MTGRTMTDEQFEEYFDAGCDVTDFMVEGSLLSPAWIPNHAVNLSMPAWLVDAVDAKARRLGANRQSYINMVLAESVA